MLNAHSGGYEGDVTVTRLAPDSFLMVCPTAQATRDVDHLRCHAASNASVTISDVSSSYSVLALMGPQSRDLLRRLVVHPADLDNAAFPFGTSRNLCVGHVATRAARVTYVGELGYELYVSPDRAPLLYETLHAAAKAEWREIGGTDGSACSDKSIIDLRDGGARAPAPHKPRCLPPPAHPQLNPNCPQRDPDASDVACGDGMTQCTWCMW